MEGEKNNNNKKNRCRANETEKKWYGDHCSVRWMKCCGKLEAYLSYLLR